jgi:hypothetical protein
MKIITSIIVAVLALQQAPATSQNPLLRHYRAGEKLSYHMKGVNEGWRYQADADGVVEKDSSEFFEEYAWTNFISQGKKVALAPQAASFRQRVTLDPNGHFALPDLSRIDRRLIGPVTDFATFYADLWLAVKSGKLLRPGDHFYKEYGKPSSWADGKYVLAGQSSIDFDMTFERRTRTPLGDANVVIVRHVPPRNAHVQFPAEWMQAPVADTANNWFEVRRTKDGYSASVGKETFEVKLNVSAADGRILSATMDDTVVTTERECQDAALHSCGEAKPHTIHREIGMELVREVRSRG